MNEPENPTKTSTYRLFHDSDGCIASFRTHSFDFLGVHPETVGDAKFWEIANANPDFWITMPLIDGAEDYWKKIVHLNPIVLTGAPRSNFEAAAEAKKEWWKKNFGHDNVIVCLSKEKKNYVTSQKDILADDNYGLVKNWRKAGGTGIHHIDFESTLRRLRNLGIID